ncbi:mannose-1-phosphate guanylyltransferase [Cohnella abietis]|uniref:Mannose-1-phosphate guanylyltransferase n=1 Tax=Cohnella abietis TaxID=2507935 RepID=A0A3T1DDA7_9BACL|nr:sugar phosphate nucleotidyltransferase [Cohnella abietis]BBI36077.1 mannose-1-phosphate guanylyltransferase [Cohnella abietis]
MKIVIMAGGKGSRLWPRSVEDRPKQFLALTSEETMLQLTYRRLVRIVPSRQIYVVTAALYRALVMEQLPELDEGKIITEPVQRDTGPCVALSALHFLRQDDDEVLVMMPSDQHIPNILALYEALSKAEAIAESSRSIVTLGIVPARPETNYGYIMTSETDSIEGARKVTSFVEKPDMEAAIKLVQLPNVYWNSGIIVWKPSTIAHSMEEHQPELWSALAGGGMAPETEYAALPKISVDYAILEKANNLFTIPFRYEWEDLGSWASLERVREEEADANGNIVHGVVHALESSNNIIFAEGRKTIVIGADDLIIVSTAEGLLICHKSKEPFLKSFVQHVEQQGGGVG